MALNWDCSPAKACYDLGRARYTMGDHAAASTNAQGDDDTDVVDQRDLMSPNKVRFGWQQHSAGDRANSPAEGMSAQDVCSYPASAFGPPFAPPRNRTGRAGGSWRHMRELRGSRGQCVMFIEGDVKARDNCKAATQCLERHGMPTFQVDRPPVPAPLQLHPHTSLKPRLIRAPRTEAMESVYSTHAREGFAYWFNDRKITGGGCVKVSKIRLDEKGWNKYFTHG